jgi:phosphatidylserine decarboxylase
MQSPGSPDQVETPPSEVEGIQPGGGWCHQVEAAWGRWRRWYLKRFRRGYVRRMQALRRGSTEGAPHEVLDPRDLKFCRNQCTAYWNDRDDPFRWREKLPFARWGLAELVLMGLPLLALTALAAIGPFAWLSPWWALLPGVPLAIVVYFFRDPPRRVPQGDDLILSPADGKVVEITHLEYDDFIEGPAVRIGIFLSVFNVHINRAPLDAEVVQMRYTPGRFLNAMSAESAKVNENMWIGLRATSPPGHRFWVRQISGALARRIVCDLRPGEQLRRGDKFGMIKLGSRTELVLAQHEQLEVTAQVGQHVKAGLSKLGRFKESGTA